MDIFYKATGAILLAVILSLTLAKEGKDFSVVLIILVCCISAVAAFSFLEQVVDFIASLEQLGNLDSQFIKILLKTVGIGLLAEIAGLICTDAGNAALGKAIGFLSTAVILWLSLPLFTELMDIVKKVLENL